MGVQELELLWRVAAREYDSLMRHARSHLQSAPMWGGLSLDPADIVHEAIRRHAVAGRRFRDETHCVACLQLSMRSVCANELRRRQLRPMEMVEDVAVAGGASEASLDEALGWLQERDEHLARVVKGCLRARCTPSELAGELGVAAPTARHQWVRALRELRGFFGCP